MLEHLEYQIRHSRPVLVLEGQVTPSVFCGSPRVLASGKEGKERGGSPGGAPGACQPTI